MLAEVRHPRDGYASVYVLAVVAAIRGEKEQALEYLEQEFRNGSPAITWIKIDPVFNWLRSDPHFIKLIKRVGLDK